MAETVNSDQTKRVLGAEDSKSDSAVSGILRQSYGSFEPKTRVGPATWSHHDILWIHNGAIRLRIEGASWLELVAPSGIWISPNTRFDGITSERRVIASITHFSRPCAPEPTRYRLVDGTRASALQAMIELSQSYAAEGVSDPVRVRLLNAILDAFDGVQQGPSATDRIHAAWLLAEDRLQDIRAVGDVAGLIGLSESAFREEHRKLLKNSAGQHLIMLRITTAKTLLVTTDLPIRVIAKQVGYSHPESFFHAFNRYVGQTPLSFRRNAAPFA